MSFIDFYCAVLLPSLTSDLPQLARSDTVLATATPTPRPTPRRGPVWDLNREIMYSPYFTLFIAIFNTTAERPSRQPGHFNARPLSRMRIGRSGGRPLYVTIMLPRRCNRIVSAIKIKKVIRAFAGTSPPNSRALFSLARFRAGFGP